MNPHTRFANIGMTHFNFEKKVFQAPGACFLLRRPQMEPVFAVKLGGQDGFLSIGALRQEFDIPADSVDGRLIAAAVAGLKFVPNIRPGDSIPTEILDGTASWSISDRHSQIAAHRIQAQLLSWLTGKEMVITDGAELEMFLGQMENKSKLREAFSRAAKALGHAEEDCGIVVTRIESLARELAYIEALRDSFKPVEAISGDLAKLSKLYASDRRTGADIQSMLKLMEQAGGDIQRRLAYVDAQTAEIIGALKGLDRQIAFIRKIRDELHFLRTDWEPLTTAWEGLEVRRMPSTEKLLGELYRYLAPRYSAGRSMFKKQDAAKAA